MLLLTSIDFMLSLPAVSKAVIAKKYVVPILRPGATWLKVVFDSVAIGVGKYDPGAVPIYTLYPAISASLLGLHDSVAEEVDGAFKVKVMGMVWDVFTAPVPVNVMVEVKEPTASLDVFTDAVTGLVPVVVEPEAGVTVSQFALSVTDQVSVPVPEFVMFNVLGAGFAAP